MAENDFSSPTKGRNTSRNATENGMVSTPVKPSSLSTGKLHSNPGSSPSSAKPKRDCC